MERKKIEIFFRNQIFLCYNGQYTKIRLFFNFIAIIARTLVQQLHRAKFALLRITYAPIFLQREHLKNAQQYFQLVGGSSTECDTIHGILLVHFYLN